MSMKRKSADVHIPAPRGADSLPVTDDRPRRGQIIKQRRIAHQITSVNQFAQVSGKSRATITKAENGIASEDTMAALERLLNTLDYERGMDTTIGPAQPAAPELDPHLEEGVIEVEVTGPSTSRDWHVVFRAHPEHVDLITEQVAKLLSEVEADDGIS